MVSDTEVYSDDYEVKAYAMRNGDWLEVHTLAKSFKLPEYVGYMFDGTSYYKYATLTSLDLSGFDTSSVTYMDGMFYGCSSLTSLDLSGFDTSSVTDMNNMFCDCSSLTKLDLSKFNTLSVTDMSNMFWYCCALENLDLSGFVFRSDGECNYKYMFSYVGVNTCNWGEEEPKTVIYVKSQEDINLLTGLGLNDYLWLDYATLQVKPSQSAE